MNKTRLEAFSDGVIAIIITIMVLELKVPHGVTWEDVSGLLPVFLSYVLSFLFVGIYWNNHHHLFQATHKINGRVLWANLHLLFWLSLIPFTTAWMGENTIAPLPVATYGFVLLMAGFAYYLLTLSLLKIHNSDSPLHQAISSKVKECVSVVTYLTALILAFWNPWISIALYLAVALLWLIPDRRIEKLIH